MRVRIVVAAGVAGMLAVFLPACRKSSVRSTVVSVPTAPAVPAPVAIAPGEFATKEGAWEYESAEGVTKLTVDLGGRVLKWVLESSGDSGGGAVMLRDPKDPWFVYLESPRSIWVYDGQETVHRAVLNPNGSMTQSTARGSSEFRFAPKTAAPQAVLDRLPKPMQGLFPVAPPPPPPEPKKVRPSI